MGEKRLVEWFAAQGGAAIAFSGGVDSTFLLACAQRALGDKAAAFTVRSAFFPQWERDDSQTYAEAIGARHIVLDADILAVEDVAQNGSRRCYHCKHYIFSLIQREAAKLGIGTVCDGSNADDAADYRPGEQAARELGVLSPLRLLGYTKQEIRECSAAMGLHSAAKPAYACLATRIPTGERIDGERLRRIEAAEDCLHALGMWDIRVRDHGDIARIEAADIQAFTRLDLAKVDEKLKLLGYRYITLDLSGYTKGSMNARGEL